MLGGKELTNLCDVQTDITKTIWFIYNQGLKSNIFKNHTRVS